MLHLFVNGPFQDCVVHALWTRDFIWKETFGGGLYQEAVLGVIVHIFVCSLMNVLNIYIYPPSIIPYTVKPFNMLGIEKHRKHPRLSFLRRR